MKKEAKVIIYLIVSFLIWFVILSFALMREDDFFSAIINYAYLVVGVLIGFLGKNRIINRPWILLLIPLVLLILGVMGFV